MNLQGKTKLGASGILFHEGKYLMGRRNNDDSQGGMYVPPGGGVEVEETIDEAVVREFKEEVGLDVHLVGNDFVSIQERILPGKHVCMVFKHVICHPDHLVEAKPLDGIQSIAWLTYAQVFQMFEVRMVTEMSYHAINEFERWRTMKMLDV